jgi:ferredoxin
VKIHIKKSACVGHARCAAVAPQLFELDDGGYIAREEIEVPPGMEELARRGARACPERIITIEE